MKHHEAQHGATSIACPRCGYDQRGVVSAWREQCPLTGTCAECGLEFDWKHVLMINRYEPAWCVEFASSLMRVPMACVKTMLKSFRPWRFWSTLHMSSRVRWWRLVVYVIALFVVLCSPYVLVQTTRAIMVRSQMMSVLNIYGMAMQPSVPQLQRAIADIESGRITEEMIGYPIDQYLAILNQQLTAAQSPQQQPSVNFSYLEAIFEAVLFPRTRFSNGTMTTPDGRIRPYPPPREYDEILYLTAPNMPAWGSWSTTGAPRRESLVLQFGSGVLLMVLLPASFVLLPASRRKAKVQWRHIGRIAIYSLALPTFFVALLVLCMGLQRIPQTTDWVPRLTWSLPLLIWVVLPMWWWAAIKRYLQMPHAFAIVALMTLVIALLCAPAWISSLPRWAERLLM